MKYNQSTRLKHIYTGNCGLVIKEYTPTGMSLTIQIRMDDGRIYFAPASEFVSISIEDLGIKI